MLVVDDALVVVEEVEDRTVGISSLQGIIEDFQSSSSSISICSDASHRDLFGHGLQDTDRLHHFSKSCGIGEEIGMKEKDIDFLCEIKLGKSGNFVPLFFRGKMRKKTGEMKKVNSVLLGGL